jgi:hypothetical protein
LLRLAVTPSSCRGAFGEVLRPGVVVGKVRTAMVVESNPKAHVPPAVRLKKGGEIQVGGRIIEWHGEHVEGATVV